MKTLPAFRILLVLLLVFVTLVATRPAYAGTHTQEVINIEDTYTLPANTVDNPCTFDISVQDFGTLRVNIWDEEKIPAN